VADTVSLFPTLRRKTMPTDRQNDKKTPGRQSILPGEDRKDEKKEPFKTK
jgi:hypothetical protein